MQTPSTFSILFWINTSRAKGNMARLYLRITLDGKRANISLNHRIDLDLWDHNLKKMIGRSRHAQTINHYLQDVSSDVFKAYRDLKSEKKNVTAEHIKCRFIGKDQKNRSLQGLIDYYNEKMVNKLAKKTLGHYKTSQKYLLKYIGSEYKASDINLRDLDYSFVIGFESFLRAYKPRHYQSQIGNNAVMKHIQRLRCMIKMAYHMEWVEKDPFIKFRPKLEKRQREFLTKAELQRIEVLNLELERLCVVRDLFVFSCYTGISYVDVMALSKEHIITGVDGKPWISAKRNKNGNPFEIPLLSKALELIEQYKDHPRANYDRRLLPKISNQKLNSYLKEIADLSRINKNLTFHMARHTFATTVTLSNGVPLETVSKLLGHTKLATTQIYARVIEQKVSADMEDLRKKLKPEKSDTGSRRSNLIIIR